MLFSDDGRRILSNHIGVPNPQGGQTEASARHRVRLLRSM